MPALVEKQGISAVNRQSALDRQGSTSNRQGTLNVLNAGENPVANQTGTKDQVGLEDLTTQKRRNSKEGGNSKEEKQQEETIEEFAEESDGYHPPELKDIQIERSNAEAQQLMICMSAILDKNGLDKTRPHKPYLRYFHRCVQRTTKAVKRCVQQYLMQQHIFDFMTTNVDDATRKRLSIAAMQRCVSREDVLSNVKESANFWGKLNVAHDNSTKAVLPGMQRLISGGNLEGKAPILPRTIQKLIKERQPDVPRPALNSGVRKRGAVTVRGVRDAVDAVKKTAEKINKFRKPKKLTLRMLVEMESESSEDEVIAEERLWKQPASQPRHTTLQASRPAVWPAMVRMASGLSVRPSTVDRPSEGHLSLILDEQERDSAMINMIGDPEDFEDLDVTPKSNRDTARSSVLQATEDGSSSVLKKISGQVKANIKATMSLTRPSLGPAKNKETESTGSQLPEASPSKRVSANGTNNDSPRARNSVLPVPEATRGSKAQEVDEASRKALKDPRVKGENKGKEPGSPSGGASPAAEEKIAPPDLQAQIERREQEPIFSPQMARARNQLGLRCSGKSSIVVQSESSMPGGKAAHVSSPPIRLAGGARLNLASSAKAAAKPTGVQRVSSSRRLPIQGQGTKMIGRAEADQRESLASRDRAISNETLRRSNSKVLPVMSRPTTQDSMKDAVPTSTSTTSPILIDTSSWPASFDAGIQSLSSSYLHGCNSADSMHRSASSQHMRTNGRVSHELLQVYGEVGGLVTPELAEKAPEVRYFRECAAQGVLPMPLKVFTDDDYMVKSGSTNVRFGAGWFGKKTERPAELRFKGLLASQGKKLLAIATTISTLKDIRVIDVSHNSLEDEFVAQLFLELRAVAARREERFESLTDIRIGYNRLGARTVKALQSVLGERATTAASGMSIDFSGVCFTHQQIQDLCMGFYLHRGMATVLFQNCELGRYNQNTCQEVIRLLTMRSLTSLDIGHNHFRGDGLIAIATMLGNEQCGVRSLSLSDNGCAQITANAPLATSDKANSDDSNVQLGLFCEMLSKNTSLTHLNLSGCNLDSQCALCIEDALYDHPTLKHLDVSRNPLGDKGLCSIVRLICGGQVPLTHVDLSQTFRVFSNPAVAFNFGDLTEEFRGQQALILSEPYHRAILRRLIARAESLGQEPEEVLRKVSVNGDRKSFSDSGIRREKNGKGWRVPTSGKLEFDWWCNVETKGQTDMKERMQEFQFQRRMVLSMIRFVLLVSAWRQLKTNEEQIQFIEAMARDLLLKQGQARFFIEETLRSKPALGGQVILMLSVALESTERLVLSAILRGARFPRSGIRGIGQMEQRRVLQSSSAMVNLNADNPTGHYSLDLGLPPQYFAGEQLLLLDRWEAEIARRKKLPDISQLGSYHAIRSMSLDGRPVRYSDAWAMPGDGFVGDGILELNFCSQVRMSKTARPTSDKILQQLLDLLNGDATDIHAAQAARFCALKEISHLLTVSASQLHECCRAFPYEKQRLDMFVTLFPRCTETGVPLVDGSTGVLADSKIWSRGARPELMDRLGMPNMFDIHNMHVPGINRHQFDLGIRDERQVACFVLKVAEAEPGMNMQECQYTGARISGFQVPVTWIEQCPTRDVWTVTYVCSKKDYMPEFRSNEAKARFAWHVTTPESDEPD